MLAMQEKNVWLGKSVLALSSQNPKRQQGFIGGVCNFACRGKDISAAIKLLCLELEESGYEVVGIESMIPAHMLDRTLTEYEVGLINATTDYPVRFKNVHLHKADS